MPEPPRFCLRYGLTIAWIGLAFTLIACGDSNGSRTGSSPKSPEPTATYGFADYQFRHVERKNCTKSKRLGNHDKATLVIQNYAVSSPFVPSCFTDVKSDSISVTIVSKDDNLHNFILEGGDNELQIKPHRSETSTFHIAAEPEIDFQCTIHAGMFGAFFR
jgi:hypothetical protein